MNRRKLINIRKRQSSFFWLVMRKGGLEKRSIASIINEERTERELWIALSP
uniref:Uncharacterized protein n=1 Tax=Arion vulgaris TaxID=1028688 RepID=A0A0B7B9D7_9EUPU